MLAHDVKVYRCSRIQPHSCFCLEMKSLFYASGLLTSELVSPGKASGLQKELVKCGKS